jgi:hypothetical protein
MPLPPDLEEPTDEQLELLDAVTVSAFIASPQQIVPFGTSTLAWQVENVPPNVKIRLGTTVVPASGWSVTSPVFTRTYALVATYGPVKRTLRTVQVTVDTSACVPLELQGAFAVMRGVLEKAVAEGEDTYWSQDPHNPDRFLWIRPVDDEVEFYMKFRLRNPGWLHPDPWVKLRGRFRFTVVDRALAASGVDAEGSVDVNWGIKLLGGFLVSLGLAVNDANEDATASARAIPDLLARSLDSLFPLSKGSAWHSVRSGENDGRPFLEATACPYGSQRRASGEE